MEDSPGPVPAKSGSAAKRPADSAARGSVADMTGESPWNFGGRMLRLFISLRFIMLIASVGTAVGALVMFGEGAGHILQGASMVMTREDPRMASALVMSGTDSFLFGIVLLIFTYSIAFGFVFDLPPDIRRAVPSWMRVEGLQELKDTLLSVILVYMVVDFATDWAATEDPLPWYKMFAKPLAIVLIALAYRLMHVGHNASSRHVVWDEDNDGG
jgi:uncharacterized membrane protein YqhA